jgi:hypothetical protein
MEGQMEFPSKLGRVVRLDGVLLAILIGSLGLNVFQSLIRTRIPVGAAGRPQTIAAGSSAPQFEGSTLDGTVVKLDYTNELRGTLLYVFSPTCVWCERNAANIQAVVKARSDLRIIGVAIGPQVTKEFVAKSPFKQILRPTAATVSSYHLSGTPATILVSPTGKVLNVWSGAYGGAIAESVSKTLAVSLPGLLQE